MLRASIESSGSTADLRAITDARAAEDSGVRGAPELIAFAEATLGGETAEIGSARDRVREVLGAEALVDAAGVIGNFERMVRIADGTGIPLDAAVAVATEDARATLGIDDFARASETKPVSSVQRFIGRVATPILRVGLEWQRRRAGR